MNPLGLVSLPADVVVALRSVPLLVERLDAITAATAELRPMRRSVDRLSADASVLPDVRAATDTLPDVLARMEAIEAAMPAVADIQRQLAELPETVDRLGQGLTDLSALLDRLLGSLNRLDDNLGTLSASLKPLGRIAERLPGSARRA